MTRSAVRSRLAPPRFALRATRGAATSEPEGRSVVSGEARRAKTDRTSAPATLPPRKPRRPLLHEARDAFAEIAAAERDQHLAIGLDRGFGQRLERHLVKLP